MAHPAWDMQLYSLLLDMLPFVEETLELDARVLLLQAGAHDIQPARGSSVPKIAVASFSCACKGYSHSDPTCIYPRMSAHHIFFADQTMMCAESAKYFE